MKSLIVFACLIVLVIDWPLVNSVATFVNGQCINPDPWHVSRVETNGVEVRSSNDLLDKLDAQLTAITQRLEALALKHNNNDNKEDKAELVLQIEVAKGWNTSLRSIKCATIDDNMKDPYYAKYKLQYEAILFRTEILRNKLNSLTELVNAIGV